MEEVLTEEEFKNMMQLDERAVEFFNLDLSDIMLAEDLSETTRDEKESPSDFHTRRRFAITKIVNILNAEWQKRENKLIQMGEVFGATLNIPTKEQIQETKERELNQLINGKYPITLYINQIWQMIKDAEKKIALLDILPKPDEI